MARNALGRGLGALIREQEAAPQTIPPTASTGAATAVAPAPSASGGPLQIDIDFLDPSPYQPRTRFAEAGIEELAQSIRASGIIQPLVVRKLGTRYQLIAGERRWRAAQRAQLLRVPVVLREVSDEQALELTLVENIQREDLNPIEQARAFDRLMDEFHLTQDEMASRTGKDRATVANSLRLLSLKKPLLEWRRGAPADADNKRQWWRLTIRIARPRWTNCRNTSALASRCTCRQRGMQVS